MSINSAMQTGVTGLIANSQALTTISNNIANVNTTAYKDELTSLRLDIQDTSPVRRRAHRNSIPQAVSTP